MDILTESIGFEYDMLTNDYDIEKIIMDKLYEAINNCDNSYINVLTESIELNSNLSRYSVLIESTETVNNIKNDIKKINKDEDKENIFQKALKPAKDLLNWWYKETPDKKFASLRLVLKLILEIVGLIIIIKTPGSRAIKAAVDNSATGNVIRNIAYKGSSKILSKLFSQEKLLLTVTRTLYLAIFTFIKKMDNKIYKKYNEERIAEDIKEYDTTIDKLNTLIEQSDNDEEKEELEKQKHICENTLAALIKIRDSK